MNKKQYTLLAITIICSVIVAYAIFSSFKRSKTKEIIKVGILHSSTGTMALSEKKLVNAALFAIEEINKVGGVLGKIVQPIIADGKSDTKIFAQEAERLITQEKVAVIFGCWTSSGRKAVKDIVEKHNNLLFYPVEYEGIEESKNIIYTGSPPSQQLIPGTIWAYKNLGQRFFLVGSDYVFPRVAHEIIKNVVLMLKGEIVGEEYIPLGSSDVSSVIEKIIQTNPSIIINTINGDTNASFIKLLRERGIVPEKIPSMFFSISEPDFESFKMTGMEGDYATWSYFQSIPTKRNRTFVRKFRKKYGDNKTIGDPMETAYLSVYLWAQSVEQAQSTAVTALQKTLKNQKYNAPEGIVYIDSNNNHTWKTTRIGKIRHNKQFTTVWDSKKSVRPVVYPPLKTKEEWQKIVNIYTNKANDE